MGSQVCAQKQISREQSVQSNRAVHVWFEGIGTCSPLLSSKQRYLQGDAEARPPIPFFSANVLFCSSTPASCSFYLHNACCTVCRFNFKSRPCGHSRPSSSSWVPTCCELLILHGSYSCSEYFDSKNV